MWCGKNKNNNNNNYNNNHHNNSGRHIFSLYDFWMELPVTLGLLLLLTSVISFTTHL